MKSLINLLELLKISFSIDHCRTDFIKILDIIDPENEKNKNNENTGQSKKDNKFILSNKFKAINSDRDTMLMDLQETTICSNKFIKPNIINKTPYKYCKGSVAGKRG